MAAWSEPPTPRRPSAHWIGFHPGNYVNDYGLFQLAKPGSAAAWEQELRTYGPLIASGHIGAVRIIPIKAAGHFILVVGVTAANEIEYKDPLRIHHSDGFGELLNLFGSAPAGPESMAFADFDDLIDNAVYAMRQ